MTKNPDKMTMNELHEETDRILFAMRTAGHDDVCETSTGWTREEMDYFISNYSDHY